MMTALGLSGLLETLQQSPPAAIAVAFVFGLLAGSFLNVVIHRLPQMMERSWHAEAAELRGEAPAPQERFDLIYPPSHCPRCKRRIRPMENIPLASWAALRGRCKGCDAPIPVRYPFVEIVAGALSAVAVWHFGAGWTGLGASILSLTLLALAFIDLDTQLLPDSITLPLLWLGLLLNLWQVFTPLQDAVIGAIAGYLSLWTIYWCFKFATGKEGMGYGDFKLLAALGAWLGWTVLPAIILLASIVGSAVGIALLALTDRAREEPIPFGPYLALAGLLALHLGPALTQWIGLA